MLLCVKPEKQNKNLVQRIKDATVLQLFLYGTALALSFSCAATKQPNIFQTQPELLTKNYTTEQITTIHQNFEADPLQYSQELGDLLLWQMHKKNSAFGRQLAELPDLNNRIDQKEAEALKTIHEYIKDVEFPNDFAGEGKFYWLEEGETGGKDMDYHLLVKWTSEKEKSDEAIITITDKSCNMVLKGVKQQDFESEDRVTLVSTPYDTRTNRVLIKIKYSTGPNDEDKLHLKFSANSNYKINLQNLGTYNIQNIADSGSADLPTKYDKAKILEELTLDGLEHDEYRYSPSLEAFLWHIMEGKFDPKKFEKYYEGSLSFVKNVWGMMEGPRWEDFDEVSARVNNPEVFDLWVNKKVIFGETRISYSKPPRQMFKDLSGDCSDVVELGKAFLDAAGYHVTRLATPTHVMGAIKRGKFFWIVIDFSIGGNGMYGPLEKFEDYRGTRLTIKHHP